MGKKRWMGVGAFGLAALVVACSDDGEEKAASKSWQCDVSQTIAACACFFDEPLHFSNPSTACTPAIGNGARCCKSGADAVVPSCACASGNDVGCSAGTHEVEKCSGLPPE